LLNVESTFCLTWQLCLLELATLPTVDATFAYC